MLTLFLLFIASVVGILIVLRVVDGFSEIPEIASLIIEDSTERYDLAYPIKYDQSGRPKKVTFITKSGRILVAKVIYNSFGTYLKRGKGSYFLRNIVF